MQKLKSYYSYNFYKKNFFADLFRKKLKKYKNSEKY